MRSVTLFMVRNKTAGYSILVASRAKRRVILGSAQAGCTSCHWPFDGASGVSHDTHEIVLVRELHMKKHKKTNNRQDTAISNREVYCTIDNTSVPSP